MAFSKSGDVRNPDNINFEEFKEREVRKDLIVFLRVLGMLRGKLGLAIIQPHLNRETTNLRKP